MSETPGRLHGLDALKGVAVLCVVAIHASPPGFEAYRASFVDGIARLAVPLFLVTTGYLVGLRAPSPERMARSAARFAGLHLLYGVCYAALAVAADGPPTLDWRALARPFGFGAWAGQFYLPILVQVYAVAALATALGWRGGPIGLALATVAATGGVAVLGSATALPPLGVAVLANAVWVWFVFFALGAALGRARAGTASPRIALALAALGTGIAATPWLDLPDWGPHPDQPYARLSIYLGAACVALALPALAACRAPRWLAAIGEESFGIYVTNPALLAGLAALMGAPQTPWASWLAVALAAAGGWALSRGLRRAAPWALP